jgi:hypothetical protein
MRFEQVAPRSRLVRKYLVRWLVSRDERIQGEMNGRAALLYERIAEGTDKLDWRCVLECARYRDSG